MQPLPHHYAVEATGEQSGPVQLKAPGVTPLATQAPPEFGGPGGCWSPESLLVAAVADCYVLSFRAVARASKLAWVDLKVRVEGVLDRVDGVTRFTGFVVHPDLLLPDASQQALAESVLEKSKRACLVSNSLVAGCELQPAIRIAA